MSSSNKKNTLQSKEYDKKIGLRLRLARVQARWSQTQLGDKLGVAFQQVQKYENGANRISSGRLYVCSFLLGVDINFFFADLPQDGEKIDDGLVASLQNDRDAIRLLFAFGKLEQKDGRRKALVNFVESLVGLGEAENETLDRNVRKRIERDSSTPRPTGVGA